VSSKNLKKHVVLFDMDGTLTPVRKSVTSEIKSMIREITDLPNCEVGIVSGSPLEYIREQMGESLYINPEKISIMPCNGTQLLRYDPEINKYRLEYSRDMKKFMTENYGKLSYHNLMLTLLDHQTSFVVKHGDFENLTGHFISYRGSMVNWSPVGREAQAPDREKFVEIDERYDIRKKMCESIKTQMGSSPFAELEFKLGGSTSIDIYPPSWDKTHALRHCEGRTTWFIGDKCQPGGNDQSLYEFIGNKLNRRSTDDQRSFETTGPVKTKMIVDSHILPKITRELK
jgi:phosphomannomutase